MITCTKCNLSKPPDDFYTERRKLNGKQSECKLCARIRNAQWAANHPEKMIEYKSIWHKKNIDLVLSRVKKWAKENPEKRAQYNSKYNKANRASANARLAAYRAAKFRATVSWTNEIAVKEFYSFAKIKSKLTSAEWEVDHIVPLQNKLVCGLHTHYNLQVIPASENQSKNNRHWSDMP